LHYARNGDIRLAYQVFGEADTTLVWVPHMLTNINYYEDPENPYGVFIRLLTPHMRVLVSDGRGTGLSERGVDDFRPEVHDSDGLMLATGDGEGGSAQGNDLALVFMPGC
jgi:pimeloyl-ACP methyl ester carboxylesterase